MSFKAKDLLIGVLPARPHVAIPGFRMAGTDDDGSEPDCDATRPQKVYDAAPSGMDLAALRYQLRERLSLQ